MGAIYGKLYNWYAVKDARGLAPIGWHISSDEEWSTLQTKLGGMDFAGGELKEIGTSHWNYPNIASNSSGFSGLPGGYRYLDGNYYKIKIKGYWWSANESSTAYAWYSYMVYDSANLISVDNPKVCGLSVRCVKDK